MDNFFKLLLIPCWIWVWVSPIVGLIYFVISFFRTDAKTAATAITIINVIAYSYLIGGFIFQDDQINGFFTHINIIHYWMIAGLLIGLLPLVRLIKK